MDENRFEIKALEDSTETLEGIIAPSIEFINFNTYSANLELSNTGFYSEEYQISYFFASTFIESLSGPETITVEPGASSNLELEIIPLNKIPRKGGSQLRIDVSNQYETKSITYVISYAETSIQLDEKGCNKHSVLLGQDIICTSTITNEGYNSNQLSIDIVVLNEKEACIFFPKNGEADLTEMFYSDNDVFHEWCLDYFRYCWYNSGEFHEHKLKE